MKKKTANQLGADLEYDCMEVFKEFIKSNLFYYDRIYDTKAAKQYIPVRPGDFYIGHMGRASVLECKASAVHPSLRSNLSNLVDDGQIAKLRLWVRSGNGAYFIFRSELSRAIELWDAQTVITAKLTGKPLPADEALMRAPYENLSDVLSFAFLKGV